MRCVSRGGYGSIPEGALVRLVRVIPAYTDKSNACVFTFPEYTVVEYEGREYTGHSHRFEEIDE